MPWELSLRKWKSEFILYPVEIWVMCIQLTAKLLCIFPILYGTYHSWKKNQGTIFLTNYSWIQSFRFFVEKWVNSRDEVALIDKIIENEKTALSCLLPATIILQGLMEEDFQKWSSKVFANVAPTYYGKMLQLFNNAQEWWFAYFPQRNNSSKTSLWTF